MGTECSIKPAKNQKIYLELAPDNKSFQGEMSQLLDRGCHSYQNISTHHTSISPLPLALSYLLSLRVAISFEIKAL